jgi:YbbR domain-containing protein
MKLWRGFISNLSSAVLALFLAVVVWVAAVYEKAPPQTDVLASAIPIKILDLGGNLLISGPVPTGARIRVRALADTWEELRADDFEATIDLFGLEAGQHEVPVIVTTLQEGVTILSIDPPRATVNLEEIAERKIRVRVKVLDEASIPLGYTSRPPVTTPDQITVTGPRTAVEQVVEASVDVSLKNARDTVVEQEAPILLDAAGSAIQGLTVSPPVVIVKIVIERQVGYRDVTVRAMTEGAPAPGYWISNITVEPALVTVYGQQSEIEALPGFLDTEPIDVNSAENDVIQRVALALPEGVLVLGEGAGAEGILVQISIQPLLGGQTIHSELKLERLRFDLKATASPTAVDIILSGPLPALQKLQPEDVQVVLNLLGLGRGTHKVTPEVVIPQGLGLEVKSIVPDIVEVTIE